MSLNKAIINIRVKLQDAKLHKSGKNKFAGFEYYELSDFLPTINALMKEYEINDIYTIEDNNAILKLIKDETVNEYKIPFVMFDSPVNKNGQPSMQQIQYLGALNTYYKRYLYLNAFGITDGEVIDALNNNDISATVTSDQILALEQLISSTKSDRSAFMKAYRINKLEDITPEAYKNAVSILHKKEAKAS